jgi:hypothetical protein
LRRKKLLANLSLGKPILQDVLSKKIPRQALMKQVVAYVTAHHGYSERRACALTRQHRSQAEFSGPALQTPPGAYGELFRHVSATARDEYTVMSRREGWVVSKNLVYRPRREEGLALRSKRPAGVSDGRSSGGAFQAEAPKRGLEQRPAHQWRQVPSELLIYIVYRRDRISGSESRTGGNEGNF